MRRRWNFKVPIIVAAIVILLFFTSCYKDYDLNTTDYDIVATDHDPKADFQSKSTYSMPDIILNISDPDGPSYDVDPAVQAYIFARIEYNMNLLGYTKVANSDSDPRDISVLVAASETDYYYYYSGCWPYYGYTYCWDYPYYGGGYYDYAYTANSLFIQLIDTKGLPPPPDGTSEPVSAIWLAGINGIKDNLSASLAQQRIEDRIDQAFEQSPYLDTTP
jgi:hypothetical protein